MKHLNFKIQFTEKLFGQLILLVLFFLLGWIISHIFEHYFLKWAKKTKTTLDDEIFKNVKKPIYILVIFFGVYFAIYNISILYQYIDKKLVDNIFKLIEILLIAFIFTRVTNVLFPGMLKDKRE
jgi:cytochrome c oxidase assembly factor CtaG